MFPHRTPGASRLTLSASDLEKLEHRNKVIGCTMLVGGLLMAGVPLTAVTLSIPLPGSMFAQLSTVMALALLGFGMAIIGLTVFVMRREP